MSYLYDPPWDEPLIARCRSCGEDVSSGGLCPVCDAPSDDEDNNETGEDYDLADLEAT